ncbi:MAG: NAD(P)H-dependent oxidoreductase [Fluviicola sp.]|nr:NAD(P)H-dependent oxidoreductase [Fluviicola sp.]
MHKIIQDLNWRYATKKFDSSKKISPEDFDIIKESLRLVPSSYGLQPLKFIIVESQYTREDLASATYGQLQVVEASHLIVICCATNIGEKEVDCHIENLANTRDLALEEVSGYGRFMKQTISKMSAEEKLSWNCKQAYIALGQLLHTCANLRIDATPMEGFDPKAYAEILGINTEEYSPILLCPIGYRDEEDATQHLKKVRKSQSVIFEVK